MDYAVKNSLVFSLPLIIDQATKYWAIQELVVPWAITPFLKLELVYNRGVTAGLFNSEDYFSFVTLIVIFVAIILAVVTIKSFKRGKDVTPQLIVLSGATSNILDRIFHCGVVDFITLHYKDWYWPTFNIADACIIIGVFWMFISYEE